MPIFAQSVPRCLWNIIPSRDESTHKYSLAHLPLLSSIVDSMCPLLSFFPSDHIVGLNVVFAENKRASKISIISDVRVFARHNFHLEYIFAITFFHLAL